MDWFLYNGLRHERVNHFTLCRNIDKTKKFEFSSCRFVFSLKILRNFKEAFLLFGQIKERLLIKIFWRKDLTFWTDLIQLLWTLSTNLSWFRDKIWTILVKLSCVSMSILSSAAYHRPFKHCSKKITQDLISTNLNFFLVKVA